MLEETRQESREKRKLKEKNRIKKSGKNLSSIYKNVVQKRVFNNFEDLADSWEGL